MQFISRMLKKQNLMHPQAIKLATLDVCGWWGGGWGGEGAVVLFPCL